jgi:hypothetical protein
MAYTKTLLELRTRIRKLADCVGDTTTGRHTTAELNSMINESWQRMRALASKNTRIYLKPATATMTAGKTSPYAWGTVSMPADCARIYGFDVTVASNDIRSLHEVSFTERNEYEGRFGQSLGIPAGFFVYNIGTEVTTTVTPGKVGILPAPMAAYSYTLWYLPSWTAITNDTYVFDGVEGWDDWVAQDVVIKLAESDNNRMETAQIATQEREKVEASVAGSSASFSQTGPVRRIDVAGMRARAASNYYPRRP